MKERRYFTKFPEQGHFPKRISADIKKYAADDVFQRSRYLFTSRRGKQQYAYCTHCRKESATTDLKHNAWEQCPKCKSQCIVKASGMGRKRLIDEAYFIYYEKSAINPQAIIASGIYAVRDYSGDYRKVKTMFLTKAFYLFEPGNSVMYKRYGYYSTDKEMYAGNFQKCSTVYSMFTQAQQGAFGCLKDIVITYSRDSIEKSVQGTPFQYSTWENYRNDGMVKFFDLCAKYPCVEYLSKLGLMKLVEAKLWDNHTYGAVNWRGKTLQAVLRLSKKDLKEIRDTDIQIGPSFLRLIQLSKKDGSKLSFEEIKTINDSIGFYITDLRIILEYTTLRRAQTYINKQFTKKKKDGKKQFYSANEIVTTWRDYIADCGRLEMDLTSDQVLFPPDLYQAHQNTIKQVKLNGDKILDKKIVARINALHRYCFEEHGFVIRPAGSTKELIDEGKALHHCVGTYADKYATGKTIILLLRQAAEMDKPFYTMEIRGGIISQCRGKNNCAMTNEVKNFVEKFKDEKLTNKKKDRVRVTVPA